MTSQARKSILDALVIQIDTEVTDFNLVTDAPTFNMLGDIPETSLPACIIESGTREPSYEVTSTVDYKMLVAMFIVCSPSTTDDELYDLDEALLDAVHSDITLDGTCLWCKEVMSDPPRLWPRGDRKTIEQRIQITYRRDL